MKRYRKKAKLAMTAALAISSLSSGMNYVFAEQENKVQENANNTEESSIEKEEVVEEKTETVEEKEELQNQEKATGDVVINADNFLDDLFRIYVSDNFDSNQDGILSIDELNAITMINIQGEDKEIASVVGIEHFPNLEDLQLYDTQVTSVDVSKNLALKKLYLYESPITSINLGKISELEVFHVWRTNNLKGLDLSNCSKLRELGIEGSNLGWVHLPDNLSLRDDPSQPFNQFVFIKTTSPNLGVISDTFNIQESFPGIDLNRIMSMEGAEIDKTTGVVSGYEAGKSINYTYDCGNNNGEKQILDVTLSFKISSTISINDNLDKPYDGNKVKEPSTTKIGSSGAITFEWFKQSEDGQWVSLEEAPTNAGNYGVKAYLAEDEYYAAADSGEPTPFTISKAQNQWRTELSMKGWVYGEEANTPQAEAQFGDVTFTYASSEDGPYTEEVPSDAGTYWVKASVEALDNYERLEAKVSFMIEKANSSITIQDDLSKAYDGEQVSEPTNVATKGSGGDLSFEWYTADGTKLEEAPAEVGSYKVKAILAEDNNYHGAEVEKAFTISQAANSWTIELSMQGWVYGEKANTPQGKAQFGDVTFTYASSEDGPYTEEVPTDAGTYWVKASVEGTDNYEGLEAKVSFTIEKANSSITIHDDLSKAYDGEPVSEPTNVEPKGSGGDLSFEWYTADGTKLEEAPAEVGSYKVKAILAEDDNYAGAEVEKAFTISQA
ncbi:MAG: MBG domain-containing protein, partial [Erysipelotrichaceae bacterium]|nr:MBG domain-containing protein [Erysipelotrichaceae bacterium]